MDANTLEFTGQSASHEGVTGQVKFTTRVKVVNKGGTIATGRDTLEVNGADEVVMINTDMNYWPAWKCNLSELHEPLIKRVQELSEAGRDTAKSMYGCDG
ncbi:MAG: glycoside hydrolase N-terminal domain-containing protein [Deltaproteobacteria bacterium]|nr:glycoside hydrolase N-terminal domain-containing protein [Deltaproteobacteria bacterium]